MNRSVLKSIWHCLPLITAITAILFVTPGSASSGVLRANLTQEFQHVDPFWTPPVTIGMSFIPAGEFEMGDHHDSSLIAPTHDVFVDSFYMDFYEVTNQRYAAALNWAWNEGLIEVTGGAVHKPGDTNTPYCGTTTSDGANSRITWDGSAFAAVSGKEWHPMVSVTWHGAAAYANWRSVRRGLEPSYDTSTWTCDFDASGFRLPTEAQWEKAARGGEHSPYYRYPWRDTISGWNGNFAASGDPYETGTYPWTTPAGYYNGSQVPAGSSMANGYGLYDMSGNVWEWCQDCYFDSYYYSSPYDNPTGPTSGSYRVMRGAAWDNFDYQLTLTCAFRYADYPFYRFHSVGFRLVLD